MHSNQTPMRCLETVIASSNCDAFSLEASCRLRRIINRRTGSNEIVYSNESWKTCESIVSIFSSFVHFARSFLLFEVFLILPKLETRLRFTKLKPFCSEKLEECGNNSELKNMLLVTVSVYSASLSHSIQKQFNSAVCVQNRLLII